MLEQHGNREGLYLRLEVPSGASHDEIARAYRRLAHGAHPDAHPGDPEAARRFQEITEAYEVLGNPVRRDRYDRARQQAHAGTDWASQAPTGGSPTPRPTSSSPSASGGPPVCLGTAPVTWEAPGLSVGPTQVTPRPSPPPMPVGEEVVPPATLNRLLAGIVGPRWRA
ncbi:MAG: J domain-containing protein [Acidimicrobiales bacterium]